MVRVLLLRDHFIGGRLLKKGQTIELPKNLQPGDRVKVVKPKPKVPRVSRN